MRDIGKQPDEIERIMEEVKDDAAFAAGVATGPPDEAAALDEEMESA